MSKRVTKLQKRAARKIIDALESRHFEMDGLRVKYRPTRNKIIIDSGFDVKGVRIEVYTTDNGEWKTGVSLTDEDWEKLNRKVTKIIRHCRKEARRQYGYGRKKPR